MWATVSTGPAASRSRPRHRRRYCGGMGIESGARGRGSDCREVVIDGIPDRLDEHTAVSRLPEQGFVPPIGHEAHLEQHTWQGARAQNVEMCGARRRRDHPHVIGELFDHSVLEPGGPRRRLRFGRSQCPGDAVGVAFGRQLRRRAAAAADIDAGAASAVIVRGIGMDRYQQVGVVTPRESQALRERDGAVPGPRQCDTIAAGSLQLTAQLLRGRERDGLFRRPCGADGAGIAPAMAGTLRGRLSCLLSPPRTLCPVVAEPVAPLAAPFVSASSTFIWPA